MCEQADEDYAIISEYRNLVIGLFSDLLDLLGKLGSDNKELKKALEAYRQGEQIETMNNLAKGD